MPSWTTGPLTVATHTYARMAITYTGGGTGRSTLTRTTVLTDGTRFVEPVFGAVSVPADEPQTWIDGDTPYGAKVASQTYSFAGYIVDVIPDRRRRSILSDPVSGISVPVIGESLGDRTFPSSTAVVYLDTVAGSDPLVNSRPEQEPTQDLGVYTTSRTAREVLQSLFSSRRRLLLRSPDREDYWFALAGERVERRLSERGRSEWRLHKWQVQMLDRPDARTSMASSGETLGHLWAKYPTDLSALNAAATTLGGLSLLITQSEVAL